MTRTEWQAALAGVPNTEGDGAPTWLTVLGVIALLITAALVIGKHMRK